MTTNEEAVAQNAIRAARVDAALLLWANTQAKEAGNSAYRSLDSCPITREELFIDLMTDARHWARLNAELIRPSTFNSIAELTEMHFNTEIDEEKKEGAQ